MTAYLNDDSPFTGDLTARSEKLPIDGRKPLHDDEAGSAWVQDLLPNGDCALPCCGRWLFWKQQAGGYRITALPPCAAMSTRAA